MWGNREIPVENGVDTGFPFIGFLEAMDIEPSFLPELCRGQSKEFDEWHDDGLGLGFVVCMEELIVFGDCSEECPSDFESGDGVGCRCDTRYSCGTLEELSECTIIGECSSEFDQWERREFPECENQPPVIIVTDGDETDLWGGCFLVRVTESLDEPLPILR